MATNLLWALLSNLWGPSLITASSFAFFQPWTNTVALLVHIYSLQLIRYAFSTVLLCSKPPAFLCASLLSSCLCAFCLSEPSECQTEPTVETRQWQLASHIIGLLTCHSPSQMFPLEKKIDLRKESAGPSITQVRLKLSLGSRCFFFFFYWANLQQIRLCKCLRGYQ